MRFMILAGALVLGPAVAGGLAQSGAAQAPSPFARIAFREIGPASAGGRVDDFAVYEKDPAVFYVATATGGLWKTVNNGTTFDPVFDHESTSSIGDVAIAPGDPNLVWVGTGENNNRQSSSWGEGLFKSTDGGRTWKNMGLTQSRHIARILVDPVDYDVVYVAALGSLWGPGGDRGVYKTTDGGLTWTRTLFVDDDTGATELVMDPSNDKTLYAATYQRRRTPWGMNGGGPGSAIWKSTDAGRTWTKLTKGIPEGDKGRIGLDVYRTDPNVVYARIEHPKEGGLYRSDDAGASWRKVSDVNPRPMYFSQIRIDPNDDHRIYMLGVQLQVSDDGGKTFSEDGARNVHVDFHAMWIDPADSNHLIVGDDGGVAISYDGSRTWVWLNNLPIGQFYHAAFDNKSPYTVCGGLQDNDTWCGPSAVRAADGIANDDWFVIGGGDGFQAQIDPSDPNVMYAESQGGRMNRVDRISNERQTIRPEPKAGEGEYRWNWDTPVVISPHDPKTVFVAANRLFRTTDRGMSWQVISPDLTTNSDRDELSIMGVVGSKIAIARNDGVSQWPTLTTFAESPRTAGIYYTGSEDGLVQVSRDAGKTWTNVAAKIPGLPKGTYVSRVAPSRFADGTVYVTFDGHRSNDFAPYVYASGDFGASWRSIAGNLPKGEVARTITEDLENEDVLYLGTETGLWFTPDRGAHWTKVTANLPTVPVYEITLQPRDNAMILATHGRSVWILDDLTPFQQWAKARASEAFLFGARPAVERNPSEARRKMFEGDRQFLGKNPPDGARLSYYLQTAPKAIVLTVRDAGGAVVRELKGDDVKDAMAAGVNTVYWDLRVEPLPRPAGPPAGGGGFGGGGLEGPRVLPGDYRVTLTMDGRDAGTTTVRVAGDPEIPISDADRKMMFDTAMALHQLQATANDAADAVRDVSAQVKRVQDLLKSAGNVPAPVKAKTEELAKQIGGLERTFGLTGGRGFGGGSQNVRGRVGQLKRQITAVTARPTDTQLRQVEEVRADLTKAVDQVNAAIAGMPAFYQLLDENGVHPKVPSVIKN